MGVDVWGLRAVIQTIGLDIAFTLFVQGLGGQSGAHGNKRPKRSRKIFHKRVHNVLRHDAFIYTSVRHY